MKYYRKFSQVHSSVGFSLVEVVIAVGLVAVAIPALLGMFGSFSEVAVKTRDRDDVESVANAVQMYLENEAGETSGNGVLPTKGTFGTVYDMVRKARLTPDQANVIYAYKSKDKDVVYTVSSTPPEEEDVSLMDGRIMAAEIHAPELSILPTSVLDPDVSKYTKAWLPLKIEIYALNTSTEPRTRLNFIESFPMVLSR